MTKPTFADWLAHWGESRLDEIIAGSQKCYREMWEARDGSRGPWQFPAWELCLGAYWQESLSEWHSRWQHCEGRLCDGRMIAAKWDGIWARLSSTFDDGLGQPYPPYARSSCAHWMAIDQDEAIVTGAISESEFKNYMARFPHETLKDKDGNTISRETLAAIRDGLDAEIYRSGGPRRGSRYNHKPKDERA